MAEHGGESRLTSGGLLRSQSTVNVCCVTAFVKLSSCNIRLIVIRLLLLLPSDIIICSAESEAPI